MPFLVNTCAMQEARRTLVNTGFVVLEGGVGCGKTFISLTLMSDHVTNNPTCTPLIISNPSEWNDAVKMNSSQTYCILIDDLIGKNEIKPGILNEWKRLGTSLAHAVKSRKVFLIITCRKYVLCQLRSLLGETNALNELLRPSSTIDFTDTRFSLTMKEKHSLLHQYLSKEVDTLTDEDKMLILNTNGVIGFPLLCDKYGFLNTTESLTSWFLAPHNLILKEIELYCALESKVPYVVMLLTMFNGFLQIPLSEEAHSMFLKLTDYFEIITVPQIQLQYCADCLKDTILSYNVNARVYTFSDDHFQTAVFHSLSVKNLPLLLEYAPLLLVNKLCSMTGTYENATGSTIHINKELFNVISSRFIRILGNKDPKQFAEMAKSAFLKFDEFLNFFLNNKTLGKNPISLFFSELDINGKSILWHASACGNASLVKAIMELVSVDDPVNNGATESQKALEICCETGTVEVLETLIAYAGFISITLLCPAIRSGNLPLIETLLSKRPQIFLEFYQTQDLDNEDINFSANDYFPDLPDGRSILHEAVSVGSLNIVQMVVQRFPNMIHKSDMNNETSVFRVSETGSLALLQVLVDHGQDLSELNNKGQSLLTMACQNGHVDIANYLICNAPGLINKQDSNKNTPAILAASNGHHKILKQLVESGCDIILANKNGQTVLHVACSGGHTLVIRYILEQRQDLVYIKDIGWRSPVFYAVSAGHLDIVKYLVDHGASITETDLVGSSLLFVACQKGRTPIVTWIIKNESRLVSQCTKYNWMPVHAAACGGSMEVLRCLAAAGADIFAEDNDGFSVLHIAAQQGEAKSVRYLIHEYPNILHRKDKKGLNAVHHAAKWGHTDVFKLLLELGSDISVSNSKGQNSFHIACMNGHLQIVSTILDKRRYLLEVKDKASWTGAHYACFGGHIAILELLVRHGADLMALTSEKYNALQIAYDEGHDIIVKFLRKEFPALRETLLNQYDEYNDIDSVWLDNETENKGNMLDRGSLFRACKTGNIVNVRNVLECMPELQWLRDDNQASAAYVAASSGHVSILKLFEEYGLDIMLRNKNGQTALHIACQEGHIDVAKYILLKYPRAANMCDNSSCTPGFYATTHGHVDTLKLLVEFGLNVFSKNIHGHTLLLTACLTGQVSMVKYLLETFPQLLHHFDHTGRSPAFLATFPGKVRILELLSEHGADFISGTDEQFSPLHLACQEGHEKVVHFLIREAPDLLHTEHNKTHCATSLAAYFGYPRILKLLVDAGMPQVTAQKLNDKVLFEACSNGDVDIVRYILHEFPEFIDKKDGNDATVSYVAAAKGHTDVLELLHDSGLDLMAANKFGQTGLHVACRAGHLSATRYLLGLHPEYVNWKDDTDCTPAYFASASGNLEVLKCLIEFGANMISCNQNGQSVLHVVCRGGKMDITEYLIQLYPELMWQMDLEWRTPLFCLVECVHCLKLMTKYKANFFHRDKYGQTVLHVASQKGYTQPLAYLARSFPALVHISDSDGMFPLHFSALENHIDCIKILESCGANINAKTNSLHTSLHLSASYGQTETLVYLGQTYPDLINIGDVDNWSAAHIAASVGHVEILDCFRLLGGCLTNKASDGQTICHLACSKGHLNVINFILEIIPDLLNSTDNNQWTPAHYAAQGGHVEILKKLSNLGVPLYSESTAGKTALHIACKEGHENCVRYLLSLCPDLITKSDHQGLTAYDYARLNNRDKLMSLLQPQVKRNDGVTVLYSRV